MKIKQCIVLALALLTLLSAAIASPPMPQDQGIIPKVQTSGTVSQKLFFSLTAATGIPWDFGSVWVTTVTPTDSSSVANALQAHSAGTSVPALYPVVRDRSGPAERWYWGTYNQQGKLVATAGLVGFSPPPATANQLLPPAGTPAYAALQQEVENYWRDDDPTTDITGVVEYTSIYLAYEGGPGFEYQGESVSSMLWDSLRHGSSPPEVMPGGHVPYETVRQYYDRSFNGGIALVRGYGTDRPGIVNHVIDGEIVPVVVPYTFEELTTEHSFAEFWQSLVPAALAEAGLTMPDPDPYHLVEFVWLVPYEWTYGTSLWAMAYPGTGQFQTNAYGYGDVAGYGPVVHEMAHACNSMRDQYYPFNYGFIGPWGVMASGSWNHEGWHVPAHLIPDVFSYWPGATVDDLSFVGPYNLGHRGYIRFLNPFSANDSTFAEWMCLAALNIGREGMQQPGTKFLAIQTNAYEECGEFG